MCVFITARTMLIFALAKHRLLYFQSCCFEITWCRQWLYLVQEKVITDFFLTSLLGKWKLSPWPKVTTRQATLWRVKEMKLSLGWTKLLIAFCLSLIKFNSEKEQTPVRGGGGGSQGWALRQSDGLASSIFMKLSLNFKSYLYWCVSHKPSREDQTDGIQ